MTMGMKHSNKTAVWKTCEPSAL